MSQSILLPAPDDWAGDHDSYQASVTDGGNGSLSNASDGESLDSGRFVGRRTKRVKKKKKKKAMRSGITTLLKECRLEDFEQKLLDYGLENVEDIAEEVRPPPAPHRSQFTHHSLDARH